MLEARKHVKTIPYLHQTLLHLSYASFFISIICTSLFVPIVLANFVLALHISCLNRLGSEMGLAASFLAGRGSPTTQMVNLVTGTLYNSFVEKDTNTFEEFHTAMLDIFNTFNSSLPGKHFDVPPRREVERCYKEWKKTSIAERKQVFVDFMKSVSLNKLDNTTIITGVVTPPVAMAAKRAGESIPPLKMLKLVPDVVFVPTATFIALISVRISRSVVSRKKKVQLEEESAST